MYNHDSELGESCTDTVDSYRNNCTIIQEVSLEQSEI